MAATADYGLGDHQFPRGWFMIAAAAELDGHKPLALRYFGRDLVLFRGHSGRLVLLSAYCAHMGAHLGKNTTSFIVRDDEQIEGDSIRCPYHGWRYGPDGKCSDIPYSPQPIPEAARVPSWVVVERAGCIWTWHDPEGGEPDFELPSFAEYDADYWVPWTIDQLGELRSHPVEIIDNMADCGHLGPVHGSIDFELFENDFDGPRVVQRFKAGHRTLVSEGALYTNTWYTGPGILLSEMAGQFPSLILITHTPIDDGVVKVWHGLLVKSPNAVPTDEDVQNARAYQAASLAAFSQDFEIWSNKQPCFTPLAVRGDGPFGLVRTWYRQFYNPRARVAEFQSRARGTVVTRGTKSAPWPRSA